MSKKIIDKIPLGCFGNKQKEYKKFLREIIIKELNNDSIFIEPFCGSAVVSFNIYKESLCKNFHINDIEDHRINFYNCIKKDDSSIPLLYDFMRDVYKKGQEEYKKYINNDNKDTYLYYIMSRVISSFRYGMYPTTKKINITNPSQNWTNFFKCSTITNYDWKEIMNEYKDDENAFIYLDPPYMDSCNYDYGKYNKIKKENQYNQDFLICDNTKIFIDILDYLKNSKCKILFSINSNAITNYIYKDFIKNEYLKKYDNTNKNIECHKNKENILIVSNF